MATATESATNFFEATFNNLRKSAESAVSLQQQLFKEWTKYWPCMTQSTMDWNASVRKSQEEWSSTITEAMRQHRELLDQQYRAGTAALEEAFQVAAAKDPEEFRTRCEALCRQTLNLVKESSESQMRQFQDAMKKWIDSCQTKH
jgi:hypothetical protein